MVHVTAKITGDGTSDASHFIITGLPFSAAQQEAVSVLSNGNYDALQGFIQASIQGTQFTMYESDGTDMTYTMIGFGNSKYVQLSGTYFV